MYPALADVVPGASTEPLPRKLVMTIWKAGSAHFAGGSEKFSEPTKPVECWTQSWKGLVSRIEKGQKLPVRDDKREHPHLGLYHSPQGFRSNREGDVVLRTGLHVDIDDGGSDETQKRLIETLTHWGLAAIVQRRDVLDPHQPKLRAIVPLVPDEERETFHSRAAAFLIALSETIRCPIDLAPAVWSQPTFIYGPVKGREKPRIVALLKGGALDLREVEGTAWARRVSGEDCPEAVELCRAMFEAAGSVFHGHRGNRPPAGDNPSAIELMPDGSFRCWTRPTYEVRAWLKMNVPEPFAAWWQHPGRRIERARSALRTRETNEPPRDRCEVERVWYVTAPVEEDTAESFATFWTEHVAPVLAQAVFPVVCVREEDAIARLDALGYEGSTLSAPRDEPESIEAHDLLVIVGPPLPSGWHPDAASDADEPRPAEFWRAMERQVELGITMLERALHVRSTRSPDAPERVRIWYFGPSFPSPPWRENECRILAT